MKWIGKDDEVAFSSVPSGGLPLLALVKLLPLLVVPLLEVPLLEVLSEVLAELPEVKALPEVAELSEVLWEAGL